MKRRHEEEEEEHGGSERWLLTYSDLITLLLAFFIILYSMSSVDSAKFKELSKYLKTAFNNNIPTSDEVPSSLEGLNLITNSGTSSTSGAGGDSGSGKDSSSGGDSGGDSSALDAANKGIDEVYNQILKYITDNKLEAKIDIEKFENELVITLKDAVLFVPDKSTMIAESAPILQQIEKSIVGVYDKIDHITISGHTADPKNDGQASSDFEWQLSSDRALAVLKYLKNSGLPQYKLSLEANSHFDPIAKNDTEANSAKNRRVEIVIRKVAVTK